MRGQRKPRRPCLAERHRGKHGRSWSKCAVPEVDTSFKCGQISYGRHGCGMPVDGGRLNGKQGRRADFEAGLNGVPAVASSPPSLCLPCLYMTRDPTWWHPAVLPCRWCQTDMSSGGGSKTAAEGADTAVWLALRSPKEFTTGGFWGERSQLSW